MSGMIATLRDALRVPCTYLDAGNPHGRVHLHAGNPHGRIHPHAVNPHGRIHPHARIPHGLIHPRAGLLTPRPRRPCRTLTPGAGAD
ncbi:hypothetical protein AQJ54_08540 [Streptomyces griseorubiginosus]|uniref:Uncharacterized protein n=1 Tax=Streptomyces griseorubiginosus TaxID=67304 RepID=A0A101S961_9ACTN|nr:hypothetical protein AQJ54_08540 [Streptomyces griseorubiginosus]